VLSKIFEKKKKNRKNILIIVEIANLTKAFSRGSDNNHNSHLAAENSVLNHYLILML